jgi:hypothetical protein
MIKTLVGFALTTVWASLLNAAVLLPQAVQAWDIYAAKAESQMRERSRGARPFLWGDESSDRRRSLASGQVVIAPAIKNGLQAAPNGLIHHWIGAIFIPKATLADLLRVVDAYACYKEFYRPYVAESRLVGASGASQEFLMIFQHRALLTNIAFEARYESREFRLSPTRGYSIASANRVQEIEAYGRAGERRLPPGTGSGFVWRLNSIARYEERENGVYLELEALALTRDIPAALAWAIEPMVKRMAFNSMASTLVNTRDRVKAVLHSPENRRLVCADQSISADLRTGGGK